MREPNCVSSLPIFFSNRVHKTFFARRHDSRGRRNHKYFHDLKNWYLHLPFEYVSRATMIWVSV